MIIYNTNSVLLFSFIQENIIIYLHMLIDTA